MKRAAALAAAVWIWCAAAPAAQAAGVPLNACEEAALAQFCAVEAAGEPYVCRLSVAAAMLNRLADARYPDTVSGILAEAGGVRGRVSRDAYRRALSAVQAAEIGMDPTNGALRWAHTGKGRFTVYFSAGTMEFGD